MSFTPWSRDAGRSQGRIKPQNATPQDGDYVLVLGSDLPGSYVKLVAGDQISYTQNGAANDATRLRIWVRVRAPSVFPTAALWRFSVVVDGFTLMSQEITRDREFHDVACSCVFGATPFDIVFTLALVDDGSGDNVLEVELPAVYIDNLVFDQAPDLFLANRDGEPDETGIVVSDNIVFWICSPFTEDNPILYTLTINGATAYDSNAGGFQPGFDGPQSDFDPQGSGMARIVVDPTSSFTSEELVTLVATYEDATVPGVKTAAWSFTCQDLTAPRLSSAVGRDLNVVRAVWNEAVNDTALTATNYTLLGIGVPTAEVLVVGVTRIDPETVELTCNVPLSMGMVYQLTAVNVADLAGNVSGSSSVQLTAFRAPQPEGRAFDLFKKLPQRVQDLDEAGTGDLKLFMACLQDVLDIQLYDIDRWTDILDPDTAPEAFLDAMLLDLGDPFSDFDLTLLQKRKLLRVLVQIYKEKGTGVGIINAVRFFVGIEVTITEWMAEWLVLGVSALDLDWVLGSAIRRDRYSYEINAPRTLTDAEEKSVTRLATYMQPAHTHLRAVLQPTPPESIDHLELGESQLDLNWTLH